jgi:hypothetical protein
MGTFNGWSIVSMPSVPSAPASVDFTANDLIAVSTSSFTGQQQIQDWQHGWIEASVSMPALTHQEAQAWIAFLMALRGQLNIFLFGDPLATHPQGSGAGAPVVAGSSQVGFSLATRGWTANALSVLLPGDWLQIGYRIYRCLNTVNADASGSATFNIWPELRESPSDGDALVLNDTKGLFRLVGNQRKWSITIARVYGIQFEIQEAI